MAFQIPVEINRFFRNFSGNFLRYKKSGGDTVFDKILRGVQSFRECWPRMLAFCRAKNDQSIDRYIYIEYFDQNERYFHKHLKMQGRVFFVTLAGDNSILSFTSDDTAVYFVSPRMLFRLVFFHRVRVPTWSVKRGCFLFFFYKGIWVHYFTLYHVI